MPAADGSAIRSVVCRQAGLAPGVREYRPLVAVKGIPCFPSAPDLRQLGTGPSVQHQELRCGEDFDLLVFAIPPAMGRLVCRRLAAQRRDWRAMLDRIGTVATHAFQVWLKPDERALAGHIPAPR